MSLLGKIKSLRSRRYQAQPSANDPSDETTNRERTVGPAEAGHRDGAPDMKSSIARGAAEGTARETVRQLIKEIKEAINN